MSFKNLTKVIGPAPSEMPRLNLMQKLSEERKRVREAITWYREQWQAKAKKGRKPKKTKAKRLSVKDKAITKMLEGTGLTLEEYKKGFAALKSQKE